MPEIAIMIEGQNGLNWENWRQIARTVDDCGFDGLFRSDHFTNPDGPYRDSLELWASLTWLADNTEAIEFGSLVTPVSFRDPVLTARTAKDVDDLSGGRFTLGVGAGWQEREHETFGYDLLPVPERFDRFEEGVEVIDALLESDEPISFDGEYYRLDDALLLPRPDRPGGPSLLVGGNGRERTMPLAAAYADEWNGVFLPPDEFAERSGHLDDLLDEAGRPADAVRRSLMTTVLFGRDDDELGDVLDGRDPDDLRDRGAVVGTRERVAATLDRLDEAGADRVMLQWLDLEGIDRLEALADAVL